jgi:hypothetical protein
MMRLALLSVRGLLQGSCTANSINHSIYQDLLRRQLIDQVLAGYGAGKIVVDFYNLNA